MKALVKPSIEPYDEIITDNEWGKWTRDHISYYTDYYGYTLIENYTPTPEPELIAV